MRFLSILIRAKLRWHAAWVEDVVISSLGAKWRAAHVQRNVSLTAVRIIRRTALTLFVLANYITRRIVFSSRSTRAFLEKGNESVHPQLSESVQDTAIESSVDLAETPAGKSLTCRVDADLEKQLRCSILENLMR
jgi:hypothetical protein